jgi:hypothetical protein
LLNNPTAASFVAVKQLLHVGYRTVANKVKGKSHKRILKTFDTWNGFVVEEEDQIRRENGCTEE